MADEAKKSKDGSKKSSSKETQQKSNESEKSKSKDEQKSNESSKEEKSSKSKEEKSLKTSSKEGSKSSGKSIGFPARRSPSLESTSSAGTGTPAARSKAVQSGEYTLTPEGGLPPECFGESVYDCCPFVILCAKHQKIALTKAGQKKACWLPYVALKSTDTYQNAAIAGTSYILGHGDIAAMAKLSSMPFKNPVILHVLRQQSTRISKFVTRVVFVVKINNDVTQWKCCKDDSKVIWVDKDDVMAGNLEKLWGPEPHLFAAAANDENRKRQIAEYSTDDAMQFVPREPIRNPEEGMLKAARFLEKDIILIYTDFTNHCYPSHYMTLFSFQSFMTKIGWNSTDVRLVAFFRAFNYRGNGFLTFHELLLGLAAMDPNTQHGGISGELRCGYIFRYYDVNNDGLIDLADLQRMTGDIYREKQEEADDKTVEKETKARMDKLGIKKADTVTFVTFLKGVADQTVRGTSVLFRADKPILQQLASQRSGDTTTDTAGDAHPMVKKVRYRGTCQACKQKTFRISTFAPRVDFSGRIFEAKSLKETEAKDIDWSNPDSITEQLRVFSRETVFNPSSLPHSLLDILRQFDAIQQKRINKTKPDKKPWAKQDRNNILNAVQAICRKAEELFASETRCVKVSSPCYVFGDTHGNIGDVLTYERNIWRAAPGESPSSYLFLGDYVDRGEFGVELCCYLFSMKILAPDKFFLCRGNHEIRSIQKCFTFFKECNVKYGTRVGPQVFEACNKAFDRMPVCAVIDDAIYGAHGGIPTSILKIEDLMRIPTPLQEPEVEAPAAWEIMWNDPMNKAEFNELAEFMKLKTENIQGFLSNTKRGTAFYYTDEAVDNFLITNGLQYVLRGHEVFQLGYKFHLNGKVTTLFSSSRYCNGTNEASAMFCDSDDMRVVRFETQGQLE